MKKVCFVSVVHQNIEDYLIDFFNSLKTQSFKYFEVILFNDGCDNNNLINLGEGLNITIFDVKGSPNEIRNEMILFLIDSDFEYCVFGDADDFFEKNRIEENINFLNNHDIVVNDVHLVNGEGELIKKNYFSNRLDNLSLIDFDFILDKNILGLGNTAIRTNILCKSLLVSSSLLAVDWHVFSKIIYVKKPRTIFINTGSVFYRQYNGNMIGLSKLSLEKVRFVVNVKIEHYKSLSSLDEIFKNKLKKYLNLNSFLEINENARAYFDKIKNTEKKCLFWWEEAHIIEELNYESTNNSK